MPNENDSPRRPPLGFMPPAWFLFTIIAMVLLWWFVPVTVAAPWPWNLLGILPIALGIGIAVVAERQFKRHGTTVLPFQESSALVTEGVFSLSRNPMYLGMVLTLLGIAVVLGALAPLIAPVGFAVFLRVAFIRHEEEAMTARFGEEYLLYKKRVRRWI